MPRTCRSFLRSAGLLLCAGLCAGDAASPTDGLARTAPDDEALAEVVLLPALKRPAAGRVPQALSVFLPKEAGYTLVLSGGLDANLELGPEQSPVLIRGSLMVPEGITLKIKAGTCMHLRGGPAGPPAGSAAPPAAGICVWGTLLAEGITGNPVEIAGQEKASAALHIYGAARHRLEGVRLKDLAVVQAGGVCIWTNCEFIGAPHYALAAGAGLFTHCSFRNCGGLFAAYNRGPWSLLARRNLFDGCREGIVLGGDPGETRLSIEKNNFVKTRGAHIRVIPFAAARGSADGGGKNAGPELLIGENWYGSALLEEAELRLVDRRVDPAVRARLNTRPPAERPYANTGAGVAAAVVSATLREQQAMQQRLLEAHAAPQVKGADQPQAAVMSKAVPKPK